MTSSFLEIIELPNGDIVLQRSGEEGEPLVNICFSEESKNYMPDSRLEIARAMIQAGIEAVALINEELSNSDHNQSQAYAGYDDEDELEPRILH